MKFSTRGFTLVELMIVIAIIGILAAALFPSLTAYLKRSRDAGRAANLNTISTSVGAYYSDTERYPAGTATGCVGATAIDNTNYFPKGLPQDPSTSASQSNCNLLRAGKAEYGYGSNAIGSGFIISAIMENSNGGNVRVAAAAGTTTGTNISLSSAQIEKGTGAIFVLTN